jgi:glycogen debranching enzyme
VKLLPGERLEAVQDLDLQDPPTWSLGVPLQGSVDATPLFIRAAVRAIERRPDFATMPVPRRDTSVRDSLEAAVGWLLRRLAGDDLGLLSHRRVNPHGLENQVWKDSWDSMSHADGTVCNHEAPVASVEAQALAYDALVQAAGHHSNPAVLLQAARAGSSERSRNASGSTIPRAASTRSE